jgi:hypothetical protein
MRAQRSIAIADRGSIGSQTVRKLSELAIVLAPRSVLEDPA